MLIPLLFFPSGFFLMIFGIWSLGKTISLVRDGIRTTGRVIEVKAIRRFSRDPAMRINYARVVKYLDNQNRSNTFEETIYSGYRFNPPKIGDHVSVIYHLEKPSEAQIISFVNMYIFPAVMIVGGVGFLAIAAAESNVKIFS